MWCRTLPTNFSWIIQNHLLPNWSWERDLGDTRIVFVLLFVLRPRILFHSGSASVLKSDVNKRSVILQVARSYEELRSAKTTRPSCSGDACTWMRVRAEGPLRSLIKQSVCIWKEMKTYKNTDPGLTQLALIWVWHKLKYSSRPCKSRPWFMAD